MEMAPRVWPNAGSVTPPVHDATDQKLLKRARYGGRSVTCLAVLLSLSAVCMVLAAVHAEGPWRVMAIPAAGVTLIAIGYWILAAAARRGNADAVKVVIIVMAVGICLSVVSAAATAARTDHTSPPQIVGVLVPLLILASLADSHKVLVKLKERQLWDHVFGAAGPSGRLCVIGAVFVLTGVSVLSVGTTYAGARVERERNAELRHARAFVQLIESEEQDFLAAMKRRASGRYPGGIEPALAAFSNLEEEFQRLQADAAGDRQLVGVLATYAEALRQWKAGLMLLRQPRADPARAQQMFSRGDQLKADACDSFDRLYGPQDR